MDGWKKVVIIIIFLHTALLESNQETLLLLYAGDTYGVKALTAHTASAEVHFKG